MCIVMGSLRMTIGRAGHSEENTESLARTFFTYHRVLVDVTNSKPDGKGEYGMESLTGQVRQS